MIGGGQQLYETVLDSVEYWVPKKAYGHERKFQSELQEFLDEDLNSGKNEMAVGVGTNGGTHVVSTEHGKSKGDVVVDDIVGIELKRDLSNNQTKKLRGQIESYLDNYDYVIACACGISDMDGWRELKKKYEGNQGLLGGSSQVSFVHKRKENFGKDPSEVNGNDGFLGGGLF